MLELSSKTNNARVELNKLKTNILMEKIIISFLVLIYTGGLLHMAFETGQVCAN